MFKILKRIETALEVLLTFVTGLVIGLALIIEPIIFDNLMVEMSTIGIGVVIICTLLYISGQVELLKKRLRE